MNPKTWGKYVWISLHLIALGYPNTPSKTEKEVFYKFFSEFYKILPCEVCSEHMKTHLISQPLTDVHLADTHSLFEWTVSIHNEVNKQLNKKIINIDQAYSIFSNEIIERQLCETKQHMNKSNTLNTTAILWCITIMSLLINIYYIYITTFQKI